MDATRLLKSLYLFQGAPQDDVRALAESLPLRRFGTGGVLFHQGELAECAWLVVSGCLVVHLETAAGVIDVGDVRAGEIAGESALLLDRVTHSASVVATVPSVCLELDPDVLAGLVGNRAVMALERHLLETVARRIRGSNRLVQRELAGAHLAHDGPGLLHRLQLALAGGAGRGAA